MQLHLLLFKTNAIQCKKNVNKTRDTKAKECNPRVSWEFSSQCNAKGACAEGAFFVTRILHAMALQQKLFIGGGITEKANTNFAVFKILAKLFS